MPTRPRRDPRPADRAIRGRRRARRPRSVAGAGCVGVAGRPTAPRPATLAAVRTDARPDRRALPARPRPRPGPVRRRSGATRHASTGAGTATASGCSQYGARGRALDGQDAATILAHYYQGATLGTDRADDDDPRPGPRRTVRRQPRLAARPVRPRRRRGRSTASRRHFPADARQARPPTPTASTAVAHDLAGARHGRRWRGPARRDDRATSGCGRPWPPTRLQVWSSPSTYDTYRGVAPRRPSTRRRRPSRRQRAAPRDVPARRRAGRDALDLADRGAAGPVDRRPLVRRPPAAARRLVLRRRATTSRRRSTAASRARSAATDAAIAATAGVGAARAARRSPTPCSTRPVAAPPSTTRTCTRRRPGPRSPGRSATCADRATGAPDGTAYDDAAPYATWATATYTRAAAVGVFAADARTNVGTLSALDLRDRGVSGPAHQRDADRVERDEDGVRASLPVGLQRRPPAGDPMLRSTLFDTQPVP